MRQIVVPKGHQVKEPEGEVHSVGADVLLIVLREELQVVVNPPFGVLAGALDVVPDGIRGLVDVAASEAVDPAASELIRGDFRAASDRGGCERLLAPRWPVV